MNPSLPQTRAEGTGAPRTHTAAHTAHAPTTTRVSPGDHVHQYLAECPPHEAVYEEVDARVEGEEEVADDVDCAEEDDGEGQAGEEHVQGYPDPEHEVRDLAQQEDEDDDNEHGRVVLDGRTVRAPAARRPLTLFVLQLVRASNGADELHVETGEGGERHEEAHDEEEDGLIHEDVGDVQTQGALAHAH